MLIRLITTSNEIHSNLIFEKTVLFKVLERWKKVQWNRYFNPTHQKNIVICPIKLQSHPTSKKINSHSTNPIQFSQPTLIFCFLPHPQNLLPSHSQRNFCHGTLKKVMPSQKNFFYPAHNPSKHFCHPTPKQFLPPYSKFFPLTSQNFCHYTPKMFLSPIPYLFPTQPKTFFTTSPKFFATPCPKVF